MLISNSKYFSGAVRGVREASKKGASMRGDTTYVTGDFTAAAMDDLCDYTVENKTKLSTAFGSGSGAMVGLAIAGPLGFVAGSMLGGKSAKTLVGGDDKDSQRQTPHNQQSSNTAPTASQQHTNRTPHHHFQNHTIQHQQSHNNTIHTQSRSIPQQDTNSQRQTPHNQQSSNTAPTVSQQHTNRTPHHHFQNHTIQHQQSHNNTIHTQSRSIPQQDTSNEGYQFGDITRSIVGKGKEADGRDKSSGYKFGKNLQFIHTNNFILLNYNSNIDNVNCS